VGAGSGKVARRATVFVGETWGEEDIPTMAVELDDETDEDVVDVIPSSALPPNTLGCWCEGLLCVKYHATPMPPAIQTTRIAPIIHTQRDIQVVPLCVFLNQELSRSLLVSSLATMLNRLQKLSPLSPRLGIKWSSDSLRMIGSVAN